ncbi:MAG: hypothetical protein J0I48_18030 [Devosia sp.]|uniref:hypothetical protein n=1 Tax=Devosia sp. 66-22 TaxID=1895753 RepID=UPI001ACB09FA|nr:hypothetical protein [Devosia sp. 66-22]MBN9348070.1 hypothetical protein [Devosia sp.]
MASGELSRPTHKGSALLRLGLELKRHRARAGRAWRRYQTLGDEVEPALAATRHGAWSEAIEDALKIADAISREQPSDLDELVIQYEAIWWWIGADDNVLDGSTQRWLGRFRRSLRRLSNQE